jgi:hypothetical protein
MPSPIPHIVTITLPLSQPLAHTQPPKGRYCIFLQQEERKRVKEIRITINQT